MSDWVKCCNTCEHRHACYRLREDDADKYEETSCVMWMGWIPTDADLKPRDMEQVEVCYNSPDGESYEDYGMDYYYKDDGFAPYVHAWHPIRPYMKVR